MDLLKYEPDKTQYMLLLERPAGGDLDLIGICTSFSWGDNENDCVGKIEFTMAQSYLPVANQWTDAICPCGSYINLYADKKYIARYRVRSNEFNEENQTVSVTAYDRIYNLSECNESCFYGEGVYTDVLINEIFGRGETGLVYNYPVVKHPQIITKNQSMLDEVSDIMDYCFEKSGAGKPILLMDGGKARITQRGWNENIYVFRWTGNMSDKGNIISFSRRGSVEGIITRIQMYGKGPNDENYTYLGFVDGHTEFDIFQRVVYADSDQNAWDLKREALKTLKEDGQYKLEFSIETPDVPHVRKGHVIKLEAGPFSGYYFVLSVSHDGKSRTMQMKIQGTSESDRVDVELTPPELQAEAEWLKAEEERKKKEEEEKNKTK